MPSGVLLGHGVIALLIGIALFLPDSWLGRELRRAYHVQTTGVLGRFVARDLLHAAAMSLVIGLLLIAGAYAAFSASFSKQGTVARLLEAYGFGFFLLGAVVFLTIIQSLWRAVRVWRTDRRIARLRSANLELVDTVREILTRYNVMELDGPEATAEHDYEAAWLLVPLLEATSFEELSVCVHAYFAAWFTPDLAGPPERFAALAQELWNVRAVPGRAA
jgi:hypothetical protein